MADIIVEPHMSVPVANVKPGNNGMVHIGDNGHIHIATMEVPEETLEEKRSRLIRERCEKAETGKLYSFAKGFAKVEDWSEELGEQARFEIAKRAGRGDDVAITTMRILENERLCKKLHETSDVREPAMVELAKRISARDWDAKRQLDSKIADLHGTAIIEEIFRTLGEHGGAEALDLLLRHIEHISPKEEEEQMAGEAVSIPPKAEEVHDPAEVTSVSESNANLLAVVKIACSKMARRAIKLIKAKEEEEQIPGASKETETTQIKRTWMPKKEASEDPNTQKIDSAREGNEAVLAIVKIASEIARSKPLKTEETATRLRHLGYARAAECIFGKLGMHMPLKRTFGEWATSFRIGMKQGFSSKPVYKKKFEPIKTH